MRRSGTAVIHLALFVGTVAPAPLVGATDLEYDLVVASAYVWRGLTVTDGVVLQPALGVSHDSGFSASVWGNLDLADANGLSGQFSELDITLSYQVPTGSPLGLEFGVIEYLFPNTADHATREVYASLVLDVALDPFLAIYYDLGEIDDFYCHLGLSHGGDLSSSISWQAAAWVGYSSDGFARAFGGTDSGLSDGNVSFDITIALTGAVSVGGFAQYVTSIDNDALPEVQPPTVGHDAEWVAGASLTISL